MKRIEKGAAYLLFDGDCGVCTYLTDVARRMDEGRKFAIEPYQVFPEPELERYGITYAKCEKRLYVITATGRVYGGAFGVNCFLWHKFPWSLAVVLICLIPVFLLLEVLGYRLVAINRARISSLFGLKACSLDHHQASSAELGQ